MSKGAFLERIVDDRKMRVNITIDRNLFDNIELLKSKKKMNSLSPQINDLLWKHLSNDFK